MQPSANLKDMQVWALRQMFRPPDLVIGDDYLRRWWIIPRNDYHNVYLHEIRHSDDDRALHDHPWDNTSVVLSGEYTEITPDGTFVRSPGQVIHRLATAKHRIEVNTPVISLFFTGPKVREWGFDCPKGWVPWFDFVDPGDIGKRGRGCE